MLVAVTVGVLLAVRAPRPRAPLTAILRGVVQLAVLSGAWPSDDLILSIDTGSPDALSISGEGVRALAGLVGGQN